MKRLQFGHKIKIAYPGTKGWPSWSTDPVLDILICCCYPFIEDELHSDCE